MKNAKSILLILVAGFGLLGMTRVIPFNISSGVMFLALGTLWLLRGIESKKHGDKGKFIITIITAIALYGISAAMFLEFIVIG